MSWCDKLASTPTVGLGFDPRYRHSSLILEAMAPLLDPQTRNEKQTFSLDRQDTFELVFSTDDGFQYSFAPTKLSVAFLHRAEVKLQSASMPVASVITEAIQYTKALSKASKGLVDAALLLHDIGNRHLLRVGVVSTTTVFEDEMPPGIREFIEYYTRPWGSVEAYSIQIVASIDETDQFKDRCIHTIVKSDDEDIIPSIALDWQRIFKTKRLARKNVLDEAVTQGQDAALSYFEQLAEGKRFHG